MEILTIGSGSSGNCYRIKGVATSLLLEAGITYKRVKKALNFKTRDVQAVLITHEHLDHAKYAQDFLKHGIDVYMTAGTKEALSLQDHYRLHILQAHIATRIGEFIILPFEAIHDAKEAVNFLIANEESNLLYATDTQYIKYRIPNLTHIMLEANYSHTLLQENIDDGIIHRMLGNRIMNSHMSLESAVDYLEKIDKTQLREVHLIHLSSTNSDTEEFKKIIQKTTGAIVSVAKGI